MAEAQRVKTTDNVVAMPRWRPAPMDDQERDQIAVMIAQYGHMVFGGCGCLRPDNLIVSYTCGLTERSLPEIIVSAVDQKSAAILLNKLSTMLPETIGPEDDLIEFKDFSNGFAAMLRRLPKDLTNESVIVKAASYYGRKLPCMQLVLSDKNHFYPWQHGASRGFVECQSPVVDWGAEIRQ